MKRNTKVRVVSIIGYSLFVILLLLGTRCESHPEITTPERDVQRIAQLAETISCEADLRAIEKLARDYEIAYREGYNGAKALHFVKLMEPVRHEAGQRLEAIRAEEDYLQGQRDALYGMLNDLEQAWKLNIESYEAACSEIERNNASIATLEDELATLVADKEQLALDIVEAGYPADMLALIGEKEDEILRHRERIAEVEHDNNIICMAYKLQYGEEFAMPQPEVSDAEPCEVVE